MKCKLLELKLLLQVKQTVRGRRTYWKALPKEKKKSIRTKNNTRTVVDKEEKMEKDKNKQMERKNGMSKQGDKHDEKYEIIQI